MKQRKLAIKLGSKTNERNTLRKSLNELLERKKSLISKVREGGEELDFDAAEVELEKLEADINELNPQVLNLDDEVKKLNKELDEAQDLSIDVEEDEEMESNKINIEGKELTPQQEERAAINAFMRSKGQTRDGFTSLEGEALIPVDRKTVPTLEKGNDELNLGALIRTVPVSTASGSYPIVKKTKAIMNSTDELAKNPKLANPEFNEVDYKVTTYRGAIPISQESIDDATVDLVGLVEDHIDRMSVNTDNAAISTLLKAFTKKPVTTIDEIKEVLNVTLDPVYSKSFVLSQSFYQLIDTVKDNQGRYLFQESLTSPSGFIFLGRPVYIAADTQLGTAGQATGWVGDIYEAITKFDRKQIGVRWLDHEIYGQYSQAGKRMQIKTVDTKAGYYLTATNLTAGPVEPSGE